MGAKMTKEQIRLTFRELCQKALHSWETTQRGTPDFEPDLLAILNFTKQNLDQKDTLVQCFIDLVYDRALGPFEVIEFCMRELRWPEVADAAAERWRSTTDPRIHIVMKDILDVYEEHWEDADLYQYYAHELDKK
jgi:hypothetical protein